MLPPQDDDEEQPAEVGASLPLKAVEEAISKVAVRVNYGLELSDATRVPAALCVWRWELRPEYRDALPKAACEKAVTRLAERVQVRIFAICS